MLDCSLLDQHRNILFRKINRDKEPKWSLEFILAPASTKLKDKDTYTTKMNLIGDFIESSGRLKDQNTVAESDDPILQ